MASRIAKAIKRTPNEEADDPLVRVRLKNSQNLITISSFIAPMKNDSRATKMRFINYGIRYFNKHQSSEADL